MKKVCRAENNVDYWDRRWAEAEKDLDTFRKLDIYPIKYADMVVTDKTDKVLELGAGLGRVLKHYHFQGFNIRGLERSTIAVERLKQEDQKLQIEAGDVCDLPYADDEFDVLLAFGLYHNLEHSLDQALKETSRCLKTGGRFCISMRPDNWEMNFNEYLWRKRAGLSEDDCNLFHKWLVHEDEFQEILMSYGLKTEALYRARNMSVLYRVPLFRAGSKIEGEKRSEGYRLNYFGSAADTILRTLFPRHICNVLVFIGRKIS